MNNEFLEKLLSYYNISNEQYTLLTKEYNLDNFWDGSSFKNVDKAVDIVKQAILNKDRIVIYGDYDTDGVMGVSILKQLFNYLKYDVGYYVPCRYIDGYGITLEKAKLFVEKNYKLVITVDNGISAFEAIEYLHNSGVKVVVIDHHQIGDELPKCDAIVHPIYCESGLNTSGAFSAYVFASNLLNRSDKYLAILASISLISDVMPLIGYNRNFLKAVFKEYKNNEFLPITLLCEGKDLNEEVIGSKISPKINSIGRIIEDTSINNLVKFFTSENHDYIITYLNTINKINEERKEMTNNLISNLTIDNNNAIIFEITQAKEGTIGLLANNLINKYHKPTFVLSRDSINGDYKCSARSIPGFNIVDAFESSKDMLVAYGGHAGAGGCTVKKELVDDFKKNLISFASKCEMKNIESKYIEASISNVNFECYNLVRSLSPFGEGWPSPKFLIRNIKTQSLKYSKNGDHIITSLGNSAKIVGFNVNKSDIDLSQYIDIIGELIFNDFYSTPSIDFRIKEIIKSKI